MARGISNQISRLWMEIDSKIVQSYTVVLQIVVIQCVVRVSYSEKEKKSIVNGAQANVKKCPE